MSCASERDFASTATRAQCSLAVDVEAVRGGVGQRLLDVDPCAAQGGGGPQRRVDARTAQVGLVQSGVLRAGSAQVRAA